MASAKQLANQKRFAMRSKRGDFRKNKKSNSSVDIVQKRRARNTGKAGTFKY